MRLCHKCGSECDSKTVFCKKCGAYLNVCDPDAAVKDLDMDTKSPKEDET